MMALPREVAEGIPAAIIAGLGGLFLALWRARHAARGATLAAPAGSGAP